MYYLKTAVKTQHFTVEESGLSPKLPLGTKKINPTRCPKGSSEVNIGYPLGLRRSGSQGMLGAILGVKK